MIPFGGYVYYLSKLLILHAKLHVNLLHGIYIFCTYHGVDAIVSFIAKVLVFISCEPTWARYGDVGPVDQSKHFGLPRFPVPLVSYVRFVSRLVWPFHISAEISMEEV